MKENSYRTIGTLGALKKAGWKSRSVKEEMRANLLKALKNNLPLFPGIIGYNRSVIPAIENAILSGHDMIFLGERGQAKTRLIRSLVNLLDEWLPVIEGCEINDDPYKPICRACKERLAKEGDNLRISWLNREERYGEKLATPDVSIADIIGEIDPVKVAEGRYLADESVIHFGLIPRTNRGIFALNELPDLAEKVQVSLFNIMEERDIQIKGFKVRLNLDVVIVASANPEDYTHRGRIITPLKDRFSSQIRTHYPLNRDIEIAIMEQERKRLGDEYPQVMVPQFMKEIIAQITLEARGSPEINQKSGVSVRMSIANYENVISNARKRALKLGEVKAVPRISDLFAVYPSSAGRLELEYSGEERDESEITEILIGRAVKTIFDKWFTIEELKTVEDVFNEGAIMEVSYLTPSAEYMDAFVEIPELVSAATKLNCNSDPQEMASALEFVLEGLHLNKRLNKKESEFKITYQGKSSALGL